MKALAAALVLLPAAAWAQFNYLPYKNYATAANPFPWYADGRSAAPGGIAFAEVQAGTQRAWSTWNAVACAVPKAQAKGSTAGTVPDPTSFSDVFNVTPIWVFQGADPLYAQVLSQAVVAISIPKAYAGVLETCDVVLNAAQHQFSISTPVLGGFVDLESTMLHEAGHCLGLDHTTTTLDDVMSTMIREGQERRALTAGDVRALCERYPLTGAPGAPCDASGGCNNVPGLKCITQPGNPLTPERFCSRGCPTGQNFRCEVPLSCQPSTAFAGSFDGACLFPGNAVTRVGRSCSANDDCGSPIGLCQKPFQGPGTEFWEGGYCQQSCKPGEPDCPAGSSCTDIGNPIPVCLQSCRLGLADCRPGYACAFNGNSGVCVPRCATDLDCGDPSQFSCRSCDGLCLTKQNPAGQLGDLCASASDCSAGQICAQLDARSALKQCTLPCATSCAACPNGSSCQLLGTRGELYCLRDCQTGTCAAPLACNTTGTGKGCLPPCLADNDCPVGLLCNTRGECAAAFQDDGGCPLCQGDAGKPIVVPPRDAGVDPGGRGGCGCGTGGFDSSVAWLFAALALLSRKATCPPRP